MGCVIHFRGFPQADTDDTYIQFRSSKLGSVPVFPELFLGSTTSNSVSCFLLAAESFNEHTVTSSFAALGSRNDQVLGNSGLSQKDSTGLVDCAEQPRLFSVGWNGVLLSCAFSCCADQNSMQLPVGNVLRFLGDVWDVYAQG